MTPLSRHRRVAALLVVFDAFYELGPDSLVRRGVPKGKVAGPFTLPSTAFPGVDHDYWVYVPAQYDGTAEASLMVFNDGGAYHRRSCRS